MSGNTRKQAMSKLKANRKIFGAWVFYKEAMIEMGNEDYEGTMHDFTISLDLMSPCTTNDPLNCR